MSKGWIALNREITNHWIWDSEPYSKGQAWVDLLLHTNHTEAKIYIKGTLIELERGQQARSQVTLANEWKWSRDKVKRFLKLLEKDGMIKQKTSQLTSIVTICNYKEYQHSKTADKSTDDTPSKQQADIKQVTVNNVNKNNNDKKDKIPYSAIAELYNNDFANNSGNSHIAKLTDKRKRLIKTAWNFDTDSTTDKFLTNNLDYWKRYFSYCSTVEFFKADCPRANGHENWCPDFEFIIKPDTQLKCREGKYK